MMLRGLAALALIATIQPALAAGPPGIAEEILRSEWSDPIPMGGYIFAPITFPAHDDQYLMVEPDRTAFADVAAAFGGTPTEESLEGLPLLWLCYETAGKRTSFVSFDTMLGLPGAPRVVGLVAEEIVKTPSPDCGANPATASPQAGNGLPGIGATIADLVNRFGEAPVDAAGHLTYVARTEVRGSVEGVESRIVHYLIESGTITGVAYLQRFQSN